MCRFSFTLIVFIVLHINTYSQNQNNVWAFGDSIGLDFNQNPPILTTSSCITIPTTTSICDPNTGGLLLYSDYSKYYNRNSIAIDSFSSSPRQNLIIPCPGNDSLFYIFSASSNIPFNQGVLYSLINIHLNGGLGGVQPGFRNVVFDPGTKINTQIAAVHHANGCDVWIIIHEFTGDVFRAYLVTSSGIQPPVFSHAGESYGGTIFYCIWFA